MALIFWEYLSFFPTFWNVRECHGMSGNFVLTGMSGNCQGILTYVREFLWKMAMPISAFAFHCAGPMGRQDHYDLRG